MEANTLQDIGQILDELEGSIKQKVWLCLSVQSLEAQLKEVVRSIERLKSQGHTIPDELRKLKLNLLMQVEHAQEITIELENTRHRLSQLALSIAHISDNGEDGKGPTDKKVIRHYLLLALKDIGGSAHCKMVKDKMREMMAGQFKPADLIKRANGELVWENNAHWVRNALVHEGVLKKDSPRGVWELNEEQR